MTKCCKCKTRIVTHKWVVKEQYYCSPLCERNGKSQFAELYRQLDKMRNPKTY